MRPTSLPFELDRDEIRSHHVDAPAIHGMLRLEADHVHIEFTTTAAGEPITQGTRIPLADVTRVAMTGGALKSPRLVLDVRHAEALMPLPWADGCMCVLRFRRAHGQELRELIAELEVRIAELNVKDRSRDSG